MQVRRSLVLAALATAAIGCGDPSSAVDPMTTARVPSLRHAFVERAAAPTAEYLSTTAKMSFDGVFDFVTVGSIGNLGTVVTFSTNPMKDTYPSWGTPPAVESAAPAILVTEGAYTQVLTLNEPVRTFGFEFMLLSIPGECTVTVTFYNGLVPVGTITRCLSDGVASLFAATTTDSDVITSASITTVNGVFAIAQVRYNLPVAAVNIDIKPGTATNTISEKAKGSVPVAILSSLAFDASSVDISTVKLGDASVILKKNGTYQSSLADVDGDGDVDLLLHFDASDIGFTSSTTSLTLTGETTGGAAIEGSDSVVIK